MPNQELGEVGHHALHIQHALSLAKKSPPKSTNFRVGAVLVDDLLDEIVSTGYTLELEGNTHAEQVCFNKFFEEVRDPNGRFRQIAALRLALYTTMEPCNKRASEHRPCTDRILETLSFEDRLQVRKVYVGVQEPEKFVGTNTGKMRLEEAGVEYIHVSGFEKEILEVATAGHEK